jgi:hypothetical protein
MSAAGPKEAIDAINACAELSAAQRAAARIRCLDANVVAIIVATPPAERAATILQLLEPPAALPASAASASGQHRPRRHATCGETRARHPCKTAAHISHITLSLSLSLSLSPSRLCVCVCVSLGRSGWLRDLTCEGVEANPGPCMVESGAASAPRRCDCQLTQEQLQANGIAVVGGTCPDCNHKASKHSSLNAASAAPAPGECAAQRICWHGIT